MDILIVLLFLIPGFAAEYIYETFSGTGHQTNTIYKILRGLTLNIPITAFAWLVIWFWKVVLGFDEMIKTLAEFWWKCINEPFILKYCIILLVGIVLVSTLLGIFGLICSKKK